MDLESKLKMFYQLLSEGWTPTYARGVSKIKQRDHSTLVAMNADYRKHFATRPYWSWNHYEIAKRDINHD